MIIVNSVVNFVYVVNASPAILHRVVASGGFISRPGWAMASTDSFHLTPSQLQCLTLVVQIWFFSIIYVFS